MILTIIDVEFLRNKIVCSRPVIHILCQIVFEGCKESVLCYLEIELQCLNLLLIDLLILAIFNWWLFRTVTHYLLRVALRWGAAMEWQSFIAGLSQDLVLMTRWRLLGRVMWLIHVPCFGCSCPGRVAAHTHHLKVSLLGLILVIFELHRILLLRFWKRFFESSFFRDTRMRHFICPYLTGLLTCNLWRQFKLLNELRVLHVVLIIDIVSLVLGQNLISQLLLLHLTLSNFVCVAHFV